MVTHIRITLGMLVVLLPFLLAQSAHAKPENRCYWDGHIAVKVENPHNPFSFDQFWHIADPTCPTYLIESAHWEWCKVGTGFFGQRKRTCYHRDSPTVNALIDKLTRERKPWKATIFADYPNQPLPYGNNGNRHGSRSNMKYLVDNYGDPITLFHYETHPDDYEHEGRFQ